MSYGATQNSYKCNGLKGKKCGQPVSSSPSPSMFHIWWHGVLVFDDGSGELQVCLEGDNLVNVLHALHAEKSLKHDLQRKVETESGRRDQDIKRDADSSYGELSFESFQNSIEMHVRSSFSSITYSFSSVTMARGYSSHLDSDYGVCSEEIISGGRFSSAGSAGLRHIENGVRKINKGSRSVQSVYNDYYDTTPSNVAQQRYLEKMKDIQMIHSFLQSCSFTSSTFEIYVKIIFSNDYASVNVKQNSASTDGLSLSLRRALGRLDSSAGSITAGGHVQSHIRKVKVQCSNVPTWTVENVELPSEAIATLKLQCLWVSRIGASRSDYSSCMGARNSVSTSSHAWTLLNQL